MNSEKLMILADQENIATVTVDKIPFTKVYYYILALLLFLN